jgi:uncharacterized DUF497 family protein
LEQTELSVTTLCTSSVDVSPSYGDRLILIAMSSRPRLVFVVHAEVGRESIRIVSARKASPAQRRFWTMLAHHHGQTLEAAARGDRDAHRYGGHV